MSNSRKIIEYTLVSAEDRHLMIAHNKMLESTLGLMTYGWQPYGSAQISTSLGNHVSHVVIIQTLVKYEEK